MAEVLDYSAGWPSPAAIRQAHYVGVVRYIGTPGRSKNLTRAEVREMRAAGIPIGLVYEESAAWMRGGAAAGAAAARAALADARTCGVGVRCVYLACDEDVTSTAMMQTVQKCLDGAAGVLGRGRVGVYGEADVIDACLGAKHATWGWQTRSWSGGRVSTRAHLLQQVGYVYPDGVQSDRSTVMKTDWGQWPDPNGDDVSAPDVWAYKIPYPSYGADVPHAKPAYSAGEYLAGLSVAAGRLLQRLDAQTAATSALATLLASGQTDLTAADVEAAVERAITQNGSQSTAGADPNPG
jgi:Rv2525c-like, glycoside hydrolase-like domain